MDFGLLLVCLFRVVFLFAISCKTFMPRFSPLHVIFHAWNFMSFMSCPKQGLKKGALSYTVAFFVSIFVLKRIKIFNSRQHNPGGGVLPYIRYIGMCRPKGYGF